MFNVFKKSIFHLEPAQIAMLVVSTALRRFNVSMSGITIHDEPLTKVYSKSDYYAFAELYFTLLLGRLVARSSGYDNCAPAPQLISNPLVATAVLAWVSFIVRDGMLMPDPDNPLNLKQKVSFASFAYDFNMYPIETRFRGHFAAYLVDAGCPEEAALDYSFSICSKVDSEINEICIEAERFWNELSASEQRTVFNDLQGLASGFFAEINATPKFDKVLQWLEEY